MQRYQVVHRDDNIHLIRTNRSECELVFWAGKSNWTQIRAILENMMKFKWFEQNLWPFHCQLIHYTVKLLGRKWRIFWQSFISCVFWSLNQYERVIFRRSNFFFQLSFSFHQIIFNWILRYQKDSHEYIHFVHFFV